MRFCGDELDVFDGFVLGSTVNQAPLILLSIAFVGFFAFVYSDLSIEGTGGYDGAKFRSGPFDFPG